MKHNWIKQPDQKLAIGGLLEQWLRTNIKNGYISKTPKRKFVACWVENEKDDLKMHKMDFEDLDSAKRFLNDTAREI